MTDKQFRKKLDQITNKKQTLKSTQEFLEVLAKGYTQQLNILIYGVSKTNDDENINQACIIKNGEKAMLYFTDKRHVKNTKSVAPAGSTYQAKCYEVNICDVINNAIEKDEVTSLVFNQGTNNMYIIPKMLLVVVLLKNSDLSD